MDKILLIIEREFKSRVQKKSFLIATLLVPLLFPAVIGGLAYFAIQEKENSGPRKLMVINEMDSLSLKSNDDFEVNLLDNPLEQALVAFNESENFGLLYVPELDIEKPEGIVLYTKTTPGPSVVGDIESLLEGHIKDLKLIKYNIDKATLSKLNTQLALDTRLSNQENEQSSSSGLASGIGYITGFLIYMFLFVYGGQVMQGVIEEKNSKIVEVIVSTVKPFHFMLGKVVGVASVGLLQIIIWIAIMGGIYMGAGSYLGLDKTREAQIEQVSKNVGADSEDLKQSIAENPKIKKAYEQIGNIPIVTVVISFVIYFIGGYLLYGALFAAVGSAVDTPADAQQFMLPIMLPIIIGFFGMSMFVFDDPSGSMSFWLSMIPFTSPIVMMGRIGFGVPLWELALSVLLLIGGFIFTIWLAGRIYRVGILMHGAKVNYKVLAKWLMMKN
ncbi:MAG: ABC transporter permease [Fulvivirga sp.]|uniref:ABC transporter permease n=1 Tax=Fulvivirga sp. TaxID=1931237 RepID=UPI0032ECA722